MLGLPRESVLASPENPANKFVLSIAPDRRYFCAVKLCTYGTHQRGRHPSLTLAWFLRLKQKMGRDMKRLTTLLLLIAAFACYTLSAQSQDSEHKWLSFTKEFDFPNASADSLFGLCYKVKLSHLNPEEISFSICDEDSHIVKYSYAWHHFEYNKDKYELCYKVFLACFEEKIIVELGDVRAYRMNYYSALGSVIHKTEYMTTNGDGVRWWANRHDEVVREQILPAFFEDLCTKIKAELIILQNQQSHFSVLS